MSVLSQMRPVDEREFSRVLAEAARPRRRSKSAAPAPSSSIGRPMQTAANVSAKAMRGITLYEPTEMVMSARAGTPLSQIESDLADRGQMLAFEPVELGPLVGSEAGQGTIGGVFATNISGARRISAGAARDHLLGVRAINGRGEVFKSGGRVMKNVTGVDLCRGLSGSWGTLAVLSEVTFKVLPVPEDTATVVILGLPDEFAVEALCTAMSSPFEVSGAVHLQPALAAHLEHEGLRSQGKAVTAVRIENFAKSVTLPQRKDQAPAQGLRRACTSSTATIRSGSGASCAGCPSCRTASGRSGASPRRPPPGRRSWPPSPPTWNAAPSTTGRAAWSGSSCRPRPTPAPPTSAASSPRTAGHATLIRAEPHVRAAVEVFQPLEPGSRKAFAQAQGRVRSGRHSQSRPHVSGILSR